MQDILVLGAGKIGALTTEQLFSSPNAAQFTLIIANELALKSVWGIYMFGFEL